VQRGLAIGILLTGSSLGAGIFSPIISHLVEIWGWRFVLQCIALLVTAGTLPIFFIFARKPSESTDDTALAAPTSEEMIGLAVNRVLQIPAYWLLTAVQLFVGFSYLGIYFYVISFLRQKGFSAEMSALIFGGLGFSAPIGYIVAGYFSDRLGAQRTLIAGLVICTLSSLLLVTVGHTFSGIGAAMAFTIFWGATINLPTQLSPILLIEISGFRHFGTLLGISTLVSGIASSFGPLLTGYLYDMTKGYTHAFLILGCLIGFSIIPTLLIYKSYMRKPVRLPYVANSLGDSDVVG
jgi:predicted MFS family arabinose efflux permease